jgi:hypothetical protein
MLRNLENIELGTGATRNFTSYTDELVSKRVRFHQQNESVLYQSEFLITVLQDIRDATKSNLLDRKREPWELENSQNTDSTKHENPSNSQLPPQLNRSFSLGILLYDIFPETSETLACALLEHITKAPLNLPVKQIKIISRRKDFAQQVLPAKFEGATVMWNFKDPNFIAQFDMVIVIGLSMHVPMLNELFSNQKCPLTVFLTSPQGAVLQRLQNVLHSELVIPVSMATTEESVPKEENSGHDVSLVSIY